MPGMSLLELISLSWRCRSEAAAALDDDMAATSRGMEDATALGSEHGGF